MDLRQDRFFQRLGDQAAGGMTGALVERTTHFVLLFKMDGCTAQAALEGFTRPMKTLPALPRERLTYDNGSRVACHAELSRRLKPDIRFDGFQIEVLTAVGKAVVGELSTVG